MMWGGVTFSARRRGDVASCQKDTATHHRNAAVLDFGVAEPPNRRFLAHASIRVALRGAVRCHTAVALARDA